MSPLSEHPKRTTFIGILVIVLSIIFGVVVEFALAGSASLIAQTLAFLVALCAFVVLGYVSIKSLRQLS